MLIALGALAVIVIGILIAASTKPNEFRIQRSAKINVPAERIVPHINDFSQWIKWSPYDSLDPDMKKTMTGASSGKGAIYEWEGNSKAGKGRMEILDSSTNHVGIDLQFEKPFRAQNVAEFALTPSGNGTDVTWSMHGRRPFASKLMGVFINMDTFVGRDFERGLQNLKSVAEHA
ncbi:MAG TPA: SRPBCC family protein [Gemmatimonadaceae bacterium]|jgi:hypothetical protein